MQLSAAELHQINKSEKIVIFKMSHFIGSSARAELLQANATMKISAGINLVYLHLLQSIQSNPCLGETIGAGIIRAQELVT